MQNWKSAFRRQIRVFSLDGRFAMVATGTKHAGCGGPKIVLAKVRSGPPRLGLECDCLSPADHAGARKNEFFLLEPLDFPRLTAGIAGITGIHVQHAEGCDLVLVEAAGLADHPAHEPLTTAESQPEYLISTALGTSQDFSLEEAFRDAVNNLQPLSNPRPSRIDVVSMGAIYGGISGFSRLFVKVEQVAFPELSSAADPATQNRVKSPLPHPRRSAGLPRLEPRRLDTTLRAGKAES